ncbi:MAG: acyltransferase family protein [Alphaproteobacteria bacterium]|nr:acyltransferase family protein [Alphaproteobacteria bacterium]
MGMADMQAVKTRIDWVDYAKGICIILVVAMHSTAGVQKEAGAISALNSFIEWAKPFRMPDFFMISGLFLASRINRPWRAYLDTKFLHFAYFYVLWMTIQFLTKGYGIYAGEGLAGLGREYLLGFVEPFGTLWFIYMLAVFFVVVKALRKVPPLAIFAVAALLEAAHIHTSATLIDEFAARFVYFFTGYWLANRVFALAAGVDGFSPFQILSGLLVWAAANLVFVQAGWSQLPGVSLCLGLVGAMAVVSSGVLLSKFKAADPLRYCGENSIVIYLSFFLFMASTRTVLLKFAPGLGLNAISLLTTMAGVIGPVLLFWATRGTRLDFLFKRPAWARLAEPGKGWHSDTHVRKPASTFQPQARGPSLSH